jgi:hypothetical protein
MKLEARLVEQGAQAAAGKKFEPIVGKFEVMITEADSGEAKNGNSFLKLKLELADGRKTGLNVFPVNNWRGKVSFSRPFKTLLAAAGLSLPKGGEFDEQVLVGRSVIAYLTENDRQGQLWQDVQKFSEVPASE